MQVSKKAYFLQALEHILLFKITNTVYVNVKEKWREQRKEKYPGQTYFFKFVSLPFQLEHI